jgi:hypothetical protein
MTTIALKRLVFIGEISMRAILAQSARRFLSCVSRP